MRNPDDFDAFYKAARHRLLLQTYALTGDLPAARGAVRDAFVHAWHHWRKVSRLEDPESWVRPHAWQHAQRRHTGRIWHRDKSLDAEPRATLDALAQLTHAQRRTLLLRELAGVPMTTMAREAGLTDEAAELQLKLAVANFAVHRDVPPAEVRRTLEGLGQRTEDARFPRPSIVRRAGAARRRAHTAAGVAVTIGAMVVGGGVVAQGNGVSPDLDAIEATAPEDGAEPEAAPLLETEDLLTREQMARLAPTRTLSGPRTDDNTGGRGLNTICQQDRFADPDGLGTYVRRFRAAGSPGLTALQVVEVSKSARAAGAAYTRTVGWYAGCKAERVQLLSAHRVTGAGDEGMLLVLRGWDRPVRTYTVAVARSGAAVTSVVRTVTDGKPTRMQPMLTVLGQSISGLCDRDFAGGCTTRPRARTSSPPAAEQAPGLLQVVDMPPVSGIDRPWVATDPTRPTLNPAATTCDEAKFTGRGISYAATRSMLIPNAALPRRFGVSETVGRFGSVAGARDFVKTIRSRMAGCEERDLSADLDQLYTQSSKRSDVTIWHLVTEIADETTIDYFVALVRRDRVVSQISFIPAPKASLPAGAFHALALRALARLENLPAR